MPTARPGSRAPHAWLRDGRSTLDLFGRGFVLLRPAGPGVEEWAPPGVEAHVVDADGFADAYDISSDGACLVRPDGIVGWRSRGQVEREELSRALDSSCAEGM